MNRHRVIMLVVFLVVCAGLWWVVSATDNLNKTTIDNANKNVELQRKRL